MRYNLIITHYILILCFFISPNFLILLLGENGYILIFCITIYLFFNLLPSLFKKYDLLFYLVFIFFILIFLIDFFTKTPLDYFIYNFLNFILISYLVLKLFVINFDKLFFIAILVNLLLLLSSFFSSQIFNIIFQGGLDQALTEDFYRFQGTFGTPGYASIFLTAVCVYSFFNFLSTNFKLGHFISFLGALILGIWTGNRSFILFTSFSFLLLILFNFKYFLLNKINSKFIIKFIAVALFFLFIVIYFDTDFLISYFKGRFENGFYNRISGENGFIDIINNMDLNSFLVGAKYITETGESYIRLNNIFYQPHNALIFYFSSYGILGLLFSIILLIYIIIRGRLTYKYEHNYIILIIVMFLFSLAEPFLFTPIQVLIFIHNKVKVRRLS